MTKSEIIAHFGSQHEVARVLGIKQPNVFRWEENDVPGHYQLIVQRITNGKLRASSKAYKDVILRVHATTRGVIQLTKPEVEEKAKTFALQPLTP